MTLGISSVDRVDPTAMRLVESGVSEEALLEELLG